VAGVESHRPLCPPPARAATDPRCPVPASTLPVVERTRHLLRGKREPRGEMRDDLAEELPRHSSTGEGRPWRSRSCVGAETGGRT
jgi:hypothetical protein